MVYNLCFTRNNGRQSRILFFFGCKKLFVLREALLKANMVLIPKSEAPDSMLQFRPLTLFNLVEKIEWRDLDRFDKE